MISFLKVKPVSHAITKRRIYRNNSPQSELQLATEKYNSAVKDDLELGILKSLLHEMKQLKQKLEKLEFSKSLHKN